MLDILEVAQKLDQQNQKFYDRFAHEFDHSRHHGWKGWHPLLQVLPDQNLRVLDVGCGNGRLIDFIQKQWCDTLQRSVELYTGLDRCDGLLDRCTQREASFKIDTQHWSWQTIHHDSLATKSDQSKQYDWVVLFGVLHHVYHDQNRVDLLAWAARHLRPGGILTVSLWDFGSYERWSKKILPRQQFAEVLACSVHDIEHYMEVNDHLLGWSHMNDTPRYCHWVNREEERMLALAVAQRVEGLSDGWSMSKEGDLNRYLCWRKDY